MLVVDVLVRFHFEKRDKKTGQRQGRKRFRKRIDFNEEKKKMQKEFVMRDKKEVKAQLSLCVISLKESRRKESGKQYQVDTQIKE